MAFQSFRTARLGLAAGLLAVSTGLAFAADGQRHAPQRVEVAVVLDTTGSMADLIDGAKKKIFSIADAIRRRNADAEVRFALIGYRDRGDVYVTDVNGLSDDLHGLYGKLIAYQADGGGDWPESVNEALHAAVTRLAWSQGDDTRRLVFLVGDAPPHMDYEQDVAFTDTLKIAARRDIRVNAIQAGEAADTEVAWRSIAALGSGDYIAIPQSGNVQVIQTPYDQDIQRLQWKLNETVLPYGDAAQKSAVADKLRLKSEAAPAAAADMAAYETRPAAPAARKVVTGAGDLVADAIAGTVDPDKIEEDALPETYKSLTSEERAARLKAAIAEREAVQSEIAALVKKRDAFLAEKAAEAGSDGDASFDGAVTATLAKQL